MRRIIIVGGGVAGMSAGIAAARAGAQVVVLEHNEIPGKKILSTGNGRCNLMNLEVNAHCYHSDNDYFLRALEEQFSAEDGLLFFRSLGIEVKCRGSYVYPRCGQATAVREAFVLELKMLGAEVVCGHHVEKILRRKPGFSVVCRSRDEKIVFEGDAVILAAGSCASSVAGSDGSGYQLAKNLGHRIVDVTPALVQLCCENKFFKKLAGVRTDGTVTLKADGQPVASDGGEIQFTNYGLSGIPVFQVSRWASKALRSGRSVEAVVDFLPEADAEQLLKKLLHRREKFPRCMAAELLNTWFPEKVIQVLLEETNIGKTIWAGKIPEERWGQLARLCKEFPAKVTGVNAFAQAQVCAGGVDTSEVCPATMESKKAPGLFLAGEVLDVDGLCGGYNIFFAAMSGMVAGSCGAKEAGE